MQSTTEGQPLLDRDTPGEEPVTDYNSKIVMLRAERHDHLHISEVVTQLRQAGDIPSEATVVRRTNPYFGPKLLLHSGDTNYLLTAPGPDTQLLLWYPKLNANGERCDWEKLAEVKAAFADDQPQYDLCSECGEPMQTLEHERRAAMGQCLGSE